MENRWDFYLNPAPVKSSKTEDDYLNRPWSDYKARASRSRSSLRNNLESKGNPLKPAKSSCKRSMNKKVFQHESKVLPHPRESLPQEACESVLKQDFLGKGSSHPRRKSSTLGSAQPNDYQTALSSPLSIPDRCASLIWMASYMGKSLRKTTLTKRRSSPIFSKNLKRLEKLGSKVVELLHAIYSPRKLDPKQLRESFKDPDILKNPWDTRRPFYSFPMSRKGKKLTQSETEIQAINAELINVLNGLDVLSRFRMQINSHLLMRPMLQKRFQDDPNSFVSLISL